MALPSGTRWFGNLLKVGGVASLCIISGIAGSALTQNFGGHDHTLSYADFVSILLSAVSLLITVLAVFLAVAGFLGWATIEQKVNDRTENFLSEGFQKGGRLDKIVVEAIEKQTRDIMFQGVQPVVDEDASSDRDNRINEDRRE